MGEKYDFSGYATRNDLKCSDGRTIRKNAFIDNDGETVPLVWQHMHNDVSNVLGHALLENREDGVYAYGKFNNTEKGQMAKSMVENGDVTALSIYANRLKQQGGNVLHGAIREVSLVLAGANPGAFIDFPVLEHGDDGDVDEAYIYMHQPLFLAHADTSEDDLEDNEDNEKDTPKGEKMAKEKTVQDVFDELTEEQKNVVYFMIGQALEDAGANNKEEDVEHYDMEGIDFMKHNVFDSETMPMDTLSHAEMATIFKDAQRFGSLKESVIQHAEEYGIENIDWLFPDARTLADQPGFIKRNPDAWVDIVMNGTHHTPFSRIKMLFADLREDDARAKGYAQKAKLKKEEVFGLLKRTVNPTTVYKKQKLDRDDVIDITDFDVVSWLKGEMRMMLDEELARAILFGDGRTALDPDKIPDANIIPIAKEASLYKIDVTPADTTPEAIIEAAVRGQNNYEGSGNTILFVGNSTVTDMLLVKDLNKHRMYKDLAELALACSVNKIVKVPDSIVPSDIVGVIVDLADYNVGADKGGSVNMFDDFDIDYNQQKYLIETRCSGCLTKPFSAVVINKASE